MDTLTPVADEQSPGWRQWAPSQRTQMARVACPQVLGPGPCPGILPVPYASVAGSGEVRLMCPACCWTGVVLLAGWG